MQAKVIVTMLPASAHVIKVYTEENGIFSGAQDGTLLLDSSTIDGNVAKYVSLSFLVVQWCARLISKAFAFNRFIHSMLTCTLKVSFM